MVLVYGNINLYRGVLDTTVSDKVCQFNCFFPDSSTNKKNNRHDVTEMLLKVAFNAIILPVILKDCFEFSYCVFASYDIYVFNFSF